jgi:RNA polymerase primary sigma factor
MASIAVQGLAEPIQTRKRQTWVMPSVVRPTRRQLARLEEQDRSLLLRLLREPAEFVDNGLFRNPAAERVLFGTSRGRPARNGRAPESLEPAGSLLAPEEETRLFQRFNCARMRQVRLLRAFRGKRMPMGKLRLLLLWGHRSMAARCRIVEANMPLVLAMARRARPVGLDFSELISEGNFALLRSVDKFDCSRGFKFSTYACRAILKSFSRVMMRNGRYRNRFPVEFEPSLERSDHLERQRQRQEGDVVEQIAVILAENRAALNDMEQQVIRERFAIKPAAAEDVTKTLEQVGQMIGVTKERVRQIQNRALRKLRTALEEDLWG